MVFLVFAMMSFAYVGLCKLDICDAHCDIISAECKKDSVNDNVNETLPKSDLDTYLKTEIPLQSANNTSSSDQVYTAVEHSATED